MSGKTYQCPWCPCFFFNQADLNKHLDAFRVLGKEPNQYDHKVRWQGELQKRDHEFIDNG